VGIPSHLKKVLILVEEIEIELKVQGGDSQNFLGKFLRFFVALGLKFLRL